MSENRQHKRIIIGFLGFLAAASVASALKPPVVFSPSENKYLQKKPEFSLSTLLDGSYGTDYEAYLSDQFPGRNGWIGIKVLAERIQGKRDVNGVYFGKQDYLIEKFEAEEIEGSMLDRNLDLLNSFLRDAEQMLGADRVRAMMVPTASQVLTSKLPFLAAPYDQGAVSDRLAQGVSETILVPVEAKLAERREEEIYYKTDHHWTALGAYYGYRAWADSIGMTPWEPSEFDIQTVSEEFLGTVYSKVNVPHDPDSIQLYLPKKPASYRIFYDGAETPGEMYTYKALEGKDQYSIYMDGNHGLTEIRNEDLSLDQERRLLIIKDSFAHSFAPFAVNHFAETYMIDLRYFNLSPKVFMQEKGITDVLVMYQIPGFAKEKTISKLR